MLLWGAGHVALGERAGWLLMAAQPLAIVTLVALAALLLEGSRWIILFPALALLVAVWLGQAMHAHRLAIRRGAAAGGEYQVALALPVVIVLLSGFWLVGGGRATPAATVQHYVAAWQADRPDAAIALFAEAPASEQLAADWQAQRAHVARLVAEAAARYGSLSGLDPAQPFNSLRFEPSQVRPGTQQAEIVVDVVRRRRVETSLFGMVPTATQETVLVERIGRLLLRAQPGPVPAWLPLAANPGQVWLIERVELQSD